MKLKIFFLHGLIGTSFEGVCHRELHFISFSPSCGNESSKIATFLTSLFHWLCRPTKLPLGAFFKSSSQTCEKVLHFFPGLFIDYGVHFQAKYRSESVAPLFPHHMYILPFKKERNITKISLYLNKFKDQNSTRFLETLPEFR